MGLLERTDRPRIFLSHAHRDADVGRWLAEELNGRIGVQTGRGIELFRTSEPRYSFEPADAAPGDNLREYIRRYEEELRAYLFEHMQRSAACLLLVTSNSADRPWIRWEIAEATRLAQERQIVFVPCLFHVGWKTLNEMSVTREPHWSEPPLLQRASKANEYQGVLLHETGGLDRLADGLVEALAP